MKKSYRKSRMLTPGLLIFILVVAINALGLAFDLYLDQTDRRTITQWVYRYPALGWPIVTWQIVGLLGILEHFYFPTKL